MKVIKVNHVVLTLGLNPAALASGGETQESIDNKVNVRLKDYDDVEVSFARTNYDERQQATHLVFVYVFKKYEETIDIGGVKVAVGKKKEPVAA